MTKRYFMIAAATAVAALSAASAARAADPTPSELREQIDQLQAKVQQLESKQTLTSKSVDDTVERVLRDADKRSQLMQMEGFTAGHNNGRFMLGSADGSFTLIP